MVELSVQRWRRYGHDRVYVNTADGERVGWLDLKSGTLTIEREELRSGALEALAAAGHTMRPEPDVPPTSEAPPPPPPTTSHELYAVRITHRDLGSREAGQAVHEQAASARQERPVLSVVARVLGVHTEERAWRIGAQGERMVAARLARLPEEWVTLHAIPVGSRGADIDHLVIGPGGVFTVNAKHHPNGNVWVAGNTFMVNGRKHPYIRNARHEAQRAGRLLSAACQYPVEVRGVIAVVGATGGFTVKEQPADVRVEARRHLHRWLLAQPRRLSPAAVAAIHRAARRSDTWTTT